MTWITRLAPGHAPDGGHLLSVLAKKTYRIPSDEIAMEDEFEPLDFVETDLFWDAGNAYLDATKEESELVACKPVTDVVVIGAAHAPRGKRARFFDTGLAIGSFKKAVRVFGDRKISLKTFGFEISEPELFESMPLHYGLAYGGRQISATGEELIYPRNPVGKGFTLSSEPRALVDLVLPNLENPAQLLTADNLVLKSFDRWQQAPKPWALGYTSRNFHPRLTFAGLPPGQATIGEIERLQAKQSEDPQPSSGPVPLMSPEFASGASEGLALPFLKGDEQVILQYMDPDVPLYRFGLPGGRPTGWIDVGEGVQNLDMVLQNVVIYKGSSQMTLVWRGSCRYGGPESMAQWERLDYGVED